MPSACKLFPPGSDPTPTDGSGAPFDSYDVLEWNRRTPGEAARRLHGPIPWEHAHLVFSEHVKMTSDPAFVDNVLHLLLEKPR